MKQSDGLLPQMEAPEKMTFSEALLASLKQQRSSLLGNGQKPLCDVILKCGNIATRSHSSVLASVSKYFERILTERHSNTQVSMYILVSLYKKQIESICQRCITVYCQKIYQTRKKPDETSYVFFLNLLEN